jgi:hypothetical protein
MLDMGEETKHHDQINPALAKDLIGNENIAAFCVLCNWVHDGRASS